MNGAALLASWLRTGLSGYVVVEQTPGYTVPEPDRPYLFVELLSRESRVASTPRLTVIENPDGTNAVNVLVEIEDTVRVTVKAETIVDAMNVGAEILDFANSESGRKLAREAGFWPNRLGDNISAPTPGDVEFFEDVLVRYVVVRSDSMFRVDDVVVPFDVDGRS